MAEGIDIYVKYQQVTDWRKVKAAGISYVYHKLSDGLTTRNANDPGAAQALGIKQGGYHFSQPGDPVAQAQLLLSQCRKWRVLDLNPALDLEDNPPNGGANIPDSQKADWAIAFGRQIVSQGLGFTLYCNNSDMQLVQARVRAALPKTHFWVARYGAKPTVYYDSWQFTSVGTVPGIKGSVDRNTGNIPVNNVGVIMALTDDEISRITTKTWYGAIWSGPLDPNKPDGPRWNLNASQVLDQLDKKLNTLIGNDAAQTALLKAVEVATQNPAISAEAMKQIVEDAVSQHLNLVIQGEVNITANPKE